ncbi:hypothetical protein FQR65_LT09963 [Abscondita terminalis]|nr:hypothetical protein FQR65_LT09963 [Abscondita terminalis]
MGVFSDTGHDMFSHFKDNFDECVKETKIDKALVETFFKEGSPADEDLKCFIYCLHIKLKFIDENGVANADEIKNALLQFADDKAKAAATIEKCSKIKESDKCETSYEIAKCLKTG